MKPLQEQTLYEILEVPVDAPEAEIVKAWDRVNGLYGPGSMATYTLMAPGEAELLGRRLDEALTILLDPEERKRYDARITGTPAPLVGRGEDGTGQRSVPAPEPRRLPPIIPPLASPASTAAPASEAAAATPVPAGTRAQAPAPARSQAEAPTPAEGPVPASAQPEPAILLSTPVAPIPLATPAPVRAAGEPAAALSTPVPVSPPFAAVAEARLAVAPPPAPPAAAQAASPSRLAPAQDLVVPDGTRFSGDVLRRAREARGLSVVEVCERTKIMRHHIENLEADRYDRLPVPVYVRGILMALAKELRLDGQKVARSYLEAMQAGLAGPGKR